MNRLIDAITRMTGGDYSARAEISGCGEIAELAAAFNHMADQIIAANNRLRESEAALRMHIENSFDVIFTLDSEGTFLFVSPSWQRHFGYPVAEVLGRNFIPFVHPQDVGPLLEYLQTILNTMQPRTSPRYRVRHADGSWRLFIANGTPHLDRNGAPLYTGVAHDITEQQQAEQAAVEALQAAEEANATKSRFLATMSHEIRTPMNGVIAMTSLLLDSRLSTKQRSYAQVVANCATALLEIINDILDFSKLEAGRMELTCAPYSLELLLQEVVTVLGPRALQNRVTLEYSAVHLPPVCCDAARLRQILLNLGGNAVKFTHDGLVSLRIDLEGVDSTSAAIRFTVTDTGIGIPAAEKESIFEPFRQADASTTRKYGGTGLGLSISKQLVEQMDGQLLCESSTGIGSTFWFSARFKLDQTQPDVALPASNPFQNRLPPLQQRHARILLAEDNRVNQIVVLAVLDRLGYQADVVSNGVEALAALTAHSYDLAIMDCQMPEMNGYEATRVIRSPHSAIRNHRIPIIALTANAMKGDREACLAAGMDEYLSKPLEPATLALVLQKWLDGLPSADRAETLQPKSSSTLAQDSGDTAAIFDEADFLRRNLDDRDLAGFVVQTFRDNIHGYLAAVWEQIATADAGRLRAQAHIIQGACATLGAGQMRATAQKLELIGKSGQLDGAAALFELLQADYRCLREVLQQRGWDQSGDPLPGTTEG